MKDTDIDTHTVPALRPILDVLLRLQDADGSVPWHLGGHTEAWCTVETAMALSIGGELEAADRCFDWLEEVQAEDGGFSSWMGGKPWLWRRETNFSAYVATGVWHRWLLTGDRAWAESRWPMVSRALDFVVAQQNPEGDIRWAVNGRGGVMNDALVTGCASIAKSLECGMALATLLQDEQRSQVYTATRTALVNALRLRPWCFDRAWESKKAHSMDWFYPVLAGVITGSEGLRRLRSRWFEFVDMRWGCRCVSNKAWYTVAETAELALALLVLGQEQKAHEIFASAIRHRDGQGYYETGYVADANRYWPTTPMSWTGAAVILVADALFKITPASALFVNNQVEVSAGESKDSCL